MDAKLTRIKQDLESAGVSIHLANRKELERLAEGRNHQGVIIELEMAHELGEADLQDALDVLHGQALFLVLDHVQDPHNLGACLRTADAAGVDGVIITKDQSVGITPTVAKVASGAAETVPLYKVTNLARALGWLKESGIWIVGAAGGGKGDEDGDDECESAIHEIPPVEGPDASTPKKSGRPPEGPAAEMRERDD